MSDQLELLEAESETARLSALQENVHTNFRGIMDIASGSEVNNHVHTHYSFSPYSPTSVAFHARMSGLQAVGSVDHDSISAAGEMRKAASIVGIGSTAGCELRVNFFSTPFAKEKLNNPDSTGIAYIVFHGVPQDSVRPLEQFLAPIVSRREERSRRELDGINETLRRIAVEPLEYDRDIRPASWVDRGGTVTERHLLNAMAMRIVEHVGDRPGLPAYLTDAMNIPVPGNVAARLSEPGNPHILYDLLGVLKSRYLPDVFIQPDEAECIAVEDAVSFARKIGAIPAYAYLGDVDESPTGDKAAQKFEDEYLDSLVPVLAELGFQSITYMPPRNSLIQLKRVQKLCARYGLLEISGVDINSSRQVFTSREVLLPEFRHLNDTTWALIAHEHLSSVDRRYGLFHPGNPLIQLPLTDRVRAYSEIGRNTDPFHPDEIGELAPSI